MRAIDNTERIVDHLALSHVPENLVIFPYYN